MQRQKQNIRMGIGIYYLKENYGMGLQISEQLKRILQNSKLQPMNKAKNLSLRERSPKFIRRSVSPILYLNSPIYKERMKKNQLVFDYGFLDPKHINRFLVQKLDHVSCKQKQDQVQNNELDHSELSQTEELSFLKNTDTGGLQKSQTRYLNSLTNDTDISTIVGDDSYLFKTKLPTQDELQMIKKRNQQLQKEMEIKNNQLEELKEMVEMQMGEVEIVVKREKLLKNQLEKCEIRLAMEQKKNSSNGNLIRKLQARVMETVKNRQNRQKQSKKGQHNKRNDPLTELFELSPDK